MSEVNLYKVAAIVLGAIVVTIIEMGLGIELKYPAWKRVAYKVTYIVWGGIIATL